MDQSFFGTNNWREMTRAQHADATPQNDEGARQRHENHQSGYQANRNRRRVAFGRGRPLATPVAVVAATISVIASAERRRQTASSTTDVFDNDFDVRRCGCARHGEVLDSPKL